jgi:PAP2 superfamily
VLSRPLTSQRPARAATAPGPTGASLVRLGLCWIALFAGVVLAGDLVLHAGHGWVDRHVDLRFEHAMWPFDETLSHVARAITVFGSQLAGVAGAVALAVVMFLRRRALTVAPLLIYAGANLIVAFGKLSVRRLGPWQREAHGITTYAFPSGHATASAALFVGAALLLTVAAPRRRRAALSIAVLAALAVAWSRLQLDVHWLTDVLAGFALGTIWPVLVVRAWQPQPSAESNAE